MPKQDPIAAGRDALILWAHLLDDVVPNARAVARPMPAAPSPGGAAWCRDCGSSGCEDFAGRYDSCKARETDVLGATVEGPDPHTGPQWQDQLGGPEYLPATRACGPKHG